MVTTGAATMEPRALTETGAVMVGASKTPDGFLFMFDVSVVSSAVSANFCEAVRFKNFSIIKKVMKFLKTPGA